MTGVVGSLLLLSVPIVWLAYRRIYRANARVEHLAHPRDCALCARGIQHDKGPIL